MELKFERVQALKKKLGFKLYLYGIEIDEDIIKVSLSIYVQIVPLWN